MDNDLIVPVDTELFHGSQNLSAQHLNASVRAVSDRQIVKPDGVGTPLKPPSNKVQVKINVVNEDTLTVIEYDGDTEYGTEFEIMKLWLLRHSSLETQFPGVTFTVVDESTVTADDGSNPIETWKVTPPYTVGATLECENGKGIRRFNEEAFFVECASGRSWAFPV